MALTANAFIEVRNIDGQTEHWALIKTSSKIYAGALLSFTAGADTVEPCSDDAAANVFAGVAAEEYDVGDGVIWAKFYSDFEMKLTLQASVSATQKGRVIYAHDDASGTDVSSKGPVIGKLRELVASTVGWVEIGKAVLGPSLT